MNDTDVSIRSTARYLLLWLVVIALFIAALPVVAQGPDEQTGEQPDQTAKRATQVQSGGQPVPAEVGPQAMVPGSFEAGVMPPSGWTHVQTNPNETWEIATSDPHSGSYYAEVLYDDALLDQDEVLLSPTFTADSGNVSLWSFGSLYWCLDTYDNCDLEVWFVNGNWDGGSGDDVYLGKADDDWTDTFEWSYSIFDFSAYASGNPARVAFRYVGNDGAQVGLDDILISSVLLDCGSAIAAECGGSYAGNTTGSPSNVDYYGCVGWEETGPEDVYVLVTSSTGDIVAALSDITTDLDVFILSGCNEGMCEVYGDDGAIYYSAPPGTYYIVVDGYEGNAGSYTLDITCGGGSEENNIYLPIVLESYPPVTNWYITNNTGGTLIVQLSGIGTRSFGGGTSLWVVPSGSHHVHITTTGCAGAIDDIYYFPPDGDRYDTYYCD